MEYKRLKYSQYFIDNSEDYNNTGNATRKIDYKAVQYKCDDLRARLFGIVHEVNYDIYYDPNRDVIQINFQKTNGNSDWFANIVESSSKYYDSIDFNGKKLQLRAHHGWGEMYRSIKHEIRESWSGLHEEHPEAATEIIGWSLGSGQAILCAQDLNYNYGLKAHVYTYGSVRPFRYTPLNKKDMLEYLSSIYASCHNFADKNDIVTYMPPFYGFVMPRRVNLGTEKRTIGRLLKPFTYHTIYDHSVLYTRENMSRENMSRKHPAGKKGGDSDGNGAEMSGKKENQEN